MDHELQKTDSRLDIGSYATLYLRIALAAAFLTSVTDGLGIWGPYGKVHVAWGDMAHFISYTAKLNPWFPSSVIPVVGWFVTAAEILLAAALLIGFQTRRAGQLSGLLLLAFAAGMTAGTGIKSALNASVFSASAGAFLLAATRSYPISLDSFRDREQSRKSRTSTAGSRTHNKEQQNSSTILQVFHTIEERDDVGFRKLLQPDFEIHWPASLPYGGTFSGREPSPKGWGATWLPLQPTENERRMDARVIAAHNDDVVVLWHQRGFSPNGTRLDEEVLGLYTLREGELARAQMFYFDTTAVARFLAAAKR